MRAFSAYWPASLASSLRRSSVRSGIGRRSVCAVGDRVEAEPGRADRLFDRADVRLVPHLHRQHARLGRRDGRDLVERHVRAVDLDRHRIEQRGRGAAGAQAAEIVLQRLDRAVHAALEIGLVIGGHRSTLLVLDDRRDALARQHRGEIAVLADVEHDDRNIVVAAQRDRAGVHHLEVVATGPCRKLTVS